MALRSLSFLALVACAACSACGATVEPRTGGRTPLAEQWLTRAKNSYRAGDFDDAQEAAKQALAASPKDPDIREMFGRVALTRLDYKSAIKATEGLVTTEAHGIRGRAMWFSGDIDNAADELEAMLHDPLVKDPWARDVARLARQAGQGRKPFEIEGPYITMVDMPRQIGPAMIGPALVVPCEVEGERILAMVATASSEVVLDSNSRKDPAWVSVRFGDRFEVKDVPALTGDLAPISRQLGVPIKALLGVNLLRHTHATFDRRGDQFIVRRGDPSAPPDGSRVPLWYLRGGGMTMRASVTVKEEADMPLLVDSARFIPVALDDATWEKSGRRRQDASPHG